MTRQLPDVPRWREWAANVWSAITRPRRLSSGGTLAIVALVLFGVWLSGTTKNYVDNRASASAARACVSYGADEASNRADEALYAYLAQRRLTDPVLQELVTASQDAKGQAKTQKDVLRTELVCPPYPPPPVVQSVGVGP